MGRKTVVIHQPDFLPYLGFFHRFLNADLYISLDHVQFVHSNRSWTHRDKIKTPKGAKWVTVAVRKAPRDTPINQIELADTGWRDENLNLFRQNYLKSACFAEVMPHIQRLYSMKCDLLRDFNMASIEMLMDLLDVRVPWIFSSKLDPQGVKNELLVDLLRKSHGTNYLSGVGAQNYFDPKPFACAGIDVEWQKFEHPIYQQCYGQFEPFLSSIDLLFNCGIERSRQILHSTKCSIAIDSSKVLVAKMGELS
jgi:hypothetical protein